MYGGDGGHYQCEIDSIGFWLHVAASGEYGSFHLSTRQVVNPGETVSFAVSSGAPAGYAVSGYLLNAS